MTTNHKPPAALPIEDDGGDMTSDLLNAIIHRWKISNLFLTKYLRRSMDTVKSYRYGRLPIPQAIADKMRRLHVFLAIDKTDKKEKTTNKRSEKCQ